MKIKIKATFFIDVELKKGLSKIERESIIMYQLGLRLKHNNMNDIPSVAFLAYSTAPDIDIIK